MNLPKVMRGLEGRNDLVVDASVLLQALQGLEGDQVYEWYAVADNGGACP